MESKNFLKWLFGPSAPPPPPASNHSSFPSPFQMPTPDPNSTPAPPDSYNAPPDPHPQPDHHLPPDLQQLDLKEPEPADQEPRAGVTDAPGEDGVGAGEEKHDRHKDSQDEDEDEEEEEEKRNEDGNESDKEGFDQKEDAEALSSPGKNNKFPVRPEAEDCAFYMKTGTCKFGSICKFNHPIPRKPQGVSISSPLLLCS